MPTRPFAKASWETSENNSWDGYATAVGPGNTQTELAFGGLTLLGSSASVVMQKVVANGQAGGTVWSQFASNQEGHAGLPPLVLPAPPPGNPHARWNPYPPAQGEPKTGSLVPKGNLGNAHPSGHLGLPPNPVIPTAPSPPPVSHSRQLKKSLQELEEEIRLAPVVEALDQIARVLLPGIGVGETIVFGIQAKARQHEILAIKLAQGDFQGAFRSQLAFMAGQGQGLQAIGER